jgi:hypothetical protein
MLDANHHNDIASSVDALQHLYDEAVCNGGALSPWPAPEERLHSPLELLAHITIYTPHLAFVFMQLAGAGPAAPECMACEARRYAALAIRLAHRALEVHARDVGYDLDAWRQRAVLESSAALSAIAIEDPSEELGIAASGVAAVGVALAAAIASVSTDRMAVPGHLASAIGGWLSCYAWAGRGKPPATD